MPEPLEPFLPAARILFPYRPHSLHMRTVGKKGDSARADRASTLPHIASGTTRSHTVFETFDPEAVSFGTSLDA